jgi:predicted RNase H-like nuclease
VLVPGLARQFAELLSRFPEAAVIVVDIPIGLNGNGLPRLCDSGARRHLGPRRSSVFPTPDRRLLEAGDCETAPALPRKIVHGGSRGLLSWRFCCVGIPELGKVW